MKKIAFNLSCCFEVALHQSRKKCCTYCNKQSAHHYMQMPCTVLSLPSFTNHCGPNTHPATFKLQLMVFALTLCRLKNPAIVWHSYTMSLSGLRKDRWPSVDPASHFELHPGLLLWYYAHTHKHAFSFHQYDPNHSPVVCAGHFWIELTNLDLNCTSVLDCTLVLISKCEHTITVN